MYNRDLGSLKPRGALVVALSRARTNIHRHIGKKKSALSWFYFACNSTFFWQDKGIPPLQRLDGTGRYKMEKVAWKRCVRQMEIFLFSPKRYFYSTPKNIFQFYTFNSWEYFFLFYFISVLSLHTLVIMINVSRGSVASLNKLLIDRLW